MLAKNNLQITVRNVGKLIVRFRIKIPKNPGTFQLRRTNSTVMQANFNTPKCLFFNFWNQNIATHIYFNGRWQHSKHLQFWAFRLPVWKWIFALLFYCACCCCNYIMMRFNYGSATFCRCWLNEIVVVSRFLLYTCCGNAYEYAFNDSPPPPPLPFVQPTPANLDKCVGAFFYDHICIYSHVCAHCVCGCV